MLTADQQLRRAGELVSQLMVRQAGRGWLGVHLTPGWPAESESPQFRPGSPPPSTSFTVNSIELNINIDLNIDVNIITVTGAVSDSHQARPGGDRSRSVKTMTAS